MCLHFGLCNLVRILYMRSPILRDIQEKITVRLLCVSELECTTLLQEANGKPFNFILPFKTLYSVVSVKQASLEISGRFGQHRRSTTKNNNDRTNNKQPSNTENASPLTRLEKCCSIIGQLIIRITIEFQLGLLRQT